MKISRPWLQRYFDEELPSASDLADALTFHAFEIESVENDILDVKVTANRGHDCLCHRGIAKELSAILELPMKADPLRQEISLAPKTDSVSVSIDDPHCGRYIAGHIKNINVGPSPEWLKNFLESIGQRSVNNIVDATNFVMFDIGQPLHAFDAGQLKMQENRYAIAVRQSDSKDRMVTLDGKQFYSFNESTLLITDFHTNIPIGIAGVKGGEAASITEITTDIIIESANFDGVATRKTAAALKLRTDASSRYEQVISAELCAFGMRAVADLIVEIAGGELVGFVDEYPKVQQQKTVAATTEQINAILGSSYSDDDVASALTRLDLEFTKQGSAFIVEPPFERLDLTIPEDIAEEVGRLYGYDAIVPQALPTMPRMPEVNANFYAAEKKREELIVQGYSEVFTSVFVGKGERVVANKVDGIHPYLRTSLVAGLNDAYEKNNRNKDLLGLKEVKLFEIGVIWKEGKEFTMLGMADKSGVREEMFKAEAADRYQDLPLSSAQRYQPFSKYPFIVRDISMWVPDTDEDRGAVIGTFAAHGGDLLRHVVLFDQFKKDGKNSLAFRLVFQSFDRTLTDEEVNERMESISRSLQERGYTIR